MDRTPATPTPITVAPTPLPLDRPGWENIVNAIGQSAQNSGNVCDYWGKSTTAQRIEPTAIFVVWDDWGGWYDHVQPLQQLVRIDQNPPPTGYTVCDPTKDQDSNLTCLNI